MYGNEHVQENFHAASALKLFNVSEFDFLSGKFSPSDVKLIKKRMALAILFTDMATMQQLRDEFQEHLDKQGIVRGKNQMKIVDTTSKATVEYSKQLVTNCLLHACDISTSLRKFELSI